MALNISSTSVILALIIVFVFAGALLFARLEAFLDVMVVVLAVVAVWLIFSDVRKDKTKEGKSTTISKENTGVLVLLIVAVVGRLVLVSVPSVEPVIPLAVYAAVTSGGIAGFVVGAFGYILSNVFLGGVFNVWTFWQALGGGIPALFAALYKEKITPGLYVSLVIVATIFFEIVVTLGTYFDLSYLASSVPYTVVHIASNALIAVILANALKK